MQPIARTLNALSDDDLLLEVKTRTLQEREVTAQIIAALAEVDARQLYLARGFPSFFKYCTDDLHFTEHEAYDRMKVARAVRQWPLMLELLADGSLTVTAARLLAPHLTIANHEAVLRAAAYTTIRRVEEQIATLRPLPDTPSTVRKLPSRRANDIAQPNADQRAHTRHSAPNDALAAQSVFESAVVASPVATSVLESKRTVMAPLSPERYRIQFTISRETRDKLRRVQDLLRHAIPDGDPAVVFDRALTAMLEDLERKKLAQVERPRHGRAANPASRHIPAAVRREVWKRDGGRCAFLGSEGRCTETGFLEFHHVVPYADGGATVASNLQLRCRAHNAYEATLYFEAFIVREGGIRTTIR